MSDTEVTMEGIIKADTRGRMKTTPERKEFLLREYERSALTGRKFSEWAGIPYSTFGNWVHARKKLLRGTAPAAALENTPGTRWLEAVMQEAEPPPPAEPGLLIVQGPYGVRLELREEGQIQLAAQLLRKLGGSEGC